MTIDDLEKLKTGDIVVDNRESWKGLEGKVVKFGGGMVKFKIIKQANNNNYPDLNSYQTFTLKNFRECYDLKRKKENSIKKL